jgi:hypothetical protein
MNIEHGTRNKEQMKVINLHNSVSLLSGINQKTFSLSQRLQRSSGTPRAGSIGYVP